MELRPYLLFYSIFVSCFSIDAATTGSSRFTHKLSSAYTNLITSTSSGSDDTTRSPTITERSTAKSEVTPGSTNPGTTRTTGSIDSGTSGTTGSIDSGTTGPTPGSTNSGTTGTTGSIYSGTTESIDSGTTGTAGSTESGTSGPTAGSTDSGTTGTFVTIDSTTTNTTSLSKADKNRPWEVFGIVLLLVIIAIGLCVGIVLKKKRRKQLRLERMKNLPSMHYTSPGTRKNTADPPRMIFTSPIYGEPTEPAPNPPLQAMREAGERWSSEDSVMSSDIGAIRSKKDDPPSLHTLRSDDNVDSLGAAGSIQNDPNETLYDVPPTRRGDKIKLIDD